MAGRSTAELHFHDGYLVYGSAWAKMKNNLRAAENSRLWLQKAEASHQETEVFQVRGMEAGCVPLEVTKEASLPRDNIMHRAEAIMLPLFSYLSRQSYSSASIKYFSRLTLRQKWVGKLHICGWDQIFLAVVQRCLELLKEKLPLLCFLLLSNVAHAPLPKSTQVNQCMLPAWLFPSLLQIGFIICSRNASTQVKKVAWPPSAFFSLVPFGSFKITLIIIKKQWLSLQSCVPLFFF